MDVGCHSDLADRYAIPGTATNVERGRPGLCECRCQECGGARFKQEGQSDRLRYRPGVELDRANHRLFVPKRGCLRHSRDVLGVVKRHRQSVLQKVVGVDPNYARGSISDGAWRRARHRQGYGPFGHAKRWQRSGTA